MHTQGQIRVAKEFLASRIAAEAEREGFPLSEVERKMLYFSAHGWTLPDIAQVHAAFQRDYDPAEYEEKIKRLIGTFQARIRTEDPQEFEAWTNAVKTLRNEDHYLLPMISAVRPPVSLFYLWVSALVVLFTIFIAMFLANRH